MITYEYLCDNCKNNFEIEQSIKDKPLNICDKCQSSEIHRVIHASSTVFVDQGPKKLSQLAERNTKKMGKYQVEDKRLAHKQSEEMARHEASLKSAQKLGHKFVDKRGKKGISKETVDKISKMDANQVKRYINGN